MQAYLINLDRSTDRLARMEAAFAASEVAFQRVPGVDGSTFSNEMIEDFSRLYPRPDGGLWKAGKIGCYLSHAKVWEIIAGGEHDRAAVFEDDLHVSGDLGALLRADGWFPDAADIVRLETTQQGVKLGPAVARVRGRRIRPVRSESWGSAAYVVTKAAAQRLAATRPSYFSVDYTLFNRDQSTTARELRVYQMVPAPCIQDQFARARGGPRLRSEIEVPREVAPVAPSGLVHRLTRLMRQSVRLIGGRRRVPFR